MFVLIRLQTTTNHLVLDDTLCKHVLKENNKYVIFCLLFLQKLTKTNNSQLFYAKGRASSVKIGTGRAGNEDKPFCGAVLNSEAGTTCGTTGT